MSVSLSRAPGGIVSVAVPLGSLTVPPAAAVIRLPVAAAGVDVVDEPLELEHAATPTTPVTAIVTIINPSFDVFM
jgi:hypothetical protein